jgi:hypothetical protein
MFMWGSELCNDPKTRHPKTVNIDIRTIPVIKWLILAQTRIRLTDITTITVHMITGHDQLDCFIINKIVFMTFIYKTVNFDDKF